MNIFYIAVVFALISCSNGGSGQQDIGGFQLDGLTFPDKGTIIYPDAGQPCEAGTPNACASCNDKCPGPDDENTKRTCENFTCGIACKNDNYDVDVNVNNGCEFEDDLPLHTTEATAKDLGTINDCDGNSAQISAVLPSDDRKHLVSPEDRSNGMPDYFKVYIDDSWCSWTPWFRLNAEKLSGDIQLTMKVTYTCEDSVGTFTKSVTVDAGYSGEVTIDQSCPGYSDDGTAIIEITKSGEDHSKEEYTIIYHA